MGCCSSEVVKVLRGTVVIETSYSTLDGEGRDRTYWQEIDEIKDRCNYSTEDILRQWPAYVMRRDLPRFLSHYELFKKVIDSPGCILDLGVWKGTSLFTWSNLMETFVPFDRSRKVFGFDTFEGLQQFSPKDGADDVSVQKEASGYLATEEEVKTLVDIHNSDNMISGTKRVNIIVGDIKETIPNFLEKNPGIRISLLHFDMDLYEPTKVALDMLYDLVLPGGVVCFDEFGLVPWQGETTAVEEFFKNRGEPVPNMQKHHFAQTPHAFFIK